jgi:hypothetical protein
LSSSLVLQDGGISDTSSSSSKRGHESQVEEYDNPIVDWDSRVEKELGDGLLVDASQSGIEDKNMMISAA